MKYALLLVCGLLTFQPTKAQKNKRSEPLKTVWDTTSFDGLKFRSVGPAFMAGRIADIAVHPDDDNLWYIAVASGGVWKTTNAGVSWKPVFDNYATYATGCISIDPNNPHRIWLGTGENVGGRHISWGDGIYLSEDDGATWKNMGLKNSEHISKIIIHPSNSNIVWVAAQGPLWSKGGERGVYKTIDGGKTWKQVLSAGEWTGATDLLIDQSNPTVLYAALWQHHRTVAAYMGGGPESGIHKSTDGGESWEALKTGLPAGNMGKIGMAISPQQPDVLYAAIEEDLRKGGVYRSENRGASWKKMSDMVSKGTGPHYYQELYACPHNFDRIYFANNIFHVSNNGGKDFERVPNKWKHVDNHALAFRADDPDYLLLGTDGGLYESFDLAENWRHMSNMPLTQFYKLALDDAKPFYNILGGTQDNSTQMGPSRTTSRAGIQNGDWKVILGGDGHQPATEPGNPDIAYGQSQQGFYSRINLKTGEKVGIRPQPEIDEPYERFNWDAPILVSPHSPTRIYVASQRVWRSENRGDEWKTISKDLTRNEERFDMPIMGKKQSYESPWDVYAMSSYNTITSISESPVQEDLLYIGTDDGFIQVTENGGKSWTKVAVSSMPGAPARAYVNDIKADKHDANVVYAALDHHKTGDYRTLLYKSTNKGKTWTSLKSNLPDSTIVWRIVQDHLAPNLLFIGTEFGAYFTANGGKQWAQLKGGLPTISFRDLAIHEREHDLVLASFGRSFYVYDDLSVFRELTEDTFDKEGTLFATRNALRYIPKSDRGYGQKGSLGEAHYASDNPPYGAQFTYYLKEGFKSLKDVRKEKENALKKENRAIDFPGWEALEAERRETKPTHWLTIRNEAGKVMRRIEVSSAKGFNRVNWDLRERSEAPLAKDAKGKDARPGGMHVSPGNYSAILSRIHDGTTVVLDSSTVQVVDLYPRKKETELQRQQFKNRRAALSQEIKKFEIQYADLKKTKKSMQEAMYRSNEQTGAFQRDFVMLNNAIEDLDIVMRGIPSKSIPGEKNDPSLYGYLYASGRVLWGSLEAPNASSLEDMARAEKKYEEVKNQFTQITNQFNLLKEKVKAADAPWFEE